MIYRLNKTSAAFFADIDKLIVKLIWKFKGTRIAKIILRKNKVGGLTLLNYKTIVTKTV